MPEWNRLVMIMLHVWAREMHFSPSCFATVCATGIDFFLGGLNPEFRENYSPICQTFLQEHRKLCDDSPLSWSKILSSASSWTNVIPHSEDHRMSTQLLEVAAWETFSELCESFKVYVIRYLQEHGKMSTSAEASNGQRNGKFLKNYSHALKSKSPSK